MVICLDVPSTSAREPIVAWKAGLFGLSALVFVNSVAINYHDYTHCQDSGGGDAAVIVASANTSTATSTFAMCSAIPNTVIDDVEYSPQPVGGHSDVEIPGRAPGNGSLKFIRIAP